MSQAKVDKYKKEKKNREKNIKKKKVKRIVTVLILAGLIGAAIGFPLGKKIYKDSEEKKAANATITASLFNNWFDEYWVTTGYPERLNFTSQDDIDNLLSTATDAASETDAATADDAETSAE